MLFVDKGGGVTVLDKPFDTETVSVETVLRMNKHLNFSLFVQRGHSLGLDTLKY